MTLRSAQAVPVARAPEAAAPSRVVATHRLRPHRTRPIRVQGDGVEVAIGHAVAGEKAKGVGASAHIPRRLHLLPLVLGVRDETTGGGPGLGLAQDLVLEARAFVGTEAIEVDPGRDPLSGIQSGRETGVRVGAGAGALVEADRL